MHKLLRLLLTAILLAASLSATAYTFISDGIYYRTITTYSVAVTYKSNSGDNRSAYTGDVTIPTSATYNGKTYSVTEIDESAFIYCDGLTSITIPRYITTIGANAFHACYNLTSVELPISLTSIGSGAFNSCRSLKAINIPAKTKIIGNPFTGCNALESITVDPSNTSYDSRNNCNAIIDKKTNTLLAGCKTTIIPETVQIIGMQAFSHIETLTKIDIPASVYSIGTFAFTGSGLKSLYIPKTVTEISSDYEYNPFAYCSNLESISVDPMNPNYSSYVNCNIIGHKSTKRLISGCSNSRIPDRYGDITAIGTSAFSGCSNLTSINIPNEVTTIGEYAFSSSGITEITLPATITNVPNYAFHNCRQLQSVNMPSVKTIGTSAFENCSKLTYLYLSPNITSIGNSALSACGYVFVDRSPCSLGTTVFNSRCTIYVPTSYEASFKSNSSWKNYTIVPHDIVTIEPSLTQVKLYSSNQSLSKVNYAMLNDGPTSPSVPLPQTFRPSNDTITIKGLIPGNGYAIEAEIELFDGKNTIYKYIYPTTNELNIIDQTISRIANVRPRVSISRDEGFFPDKIEFYTDYEKLLSTGKIVETTATSYIIEGNDYVISEPSTSQRSIPLIVEIAFGGQTKQTNFRISQTEVRFTDKTTSTQTTITPRFIVNRDNSVKLGKFWLRDYPDNKGKITSDGTDYYEIEFEPITGLTPNTTERIYWAITYNASEINYWKDFPTKELNSRYVIRKVGPTSAEVDSQIDAGDAVVVNSYFTFNSDKSTKLRATGLLPTRTYNASQHIEFSKGSKDYSLSFTTSALSMTTKPARMLTNRNPMLLAETNIADIETSCGFEWRRYDAPEEMPSTRVYCPVYGGTMAGVVKNMTENVYYKYRPFYRSADDTMYYGDWVAFITADAGVEFDPVVYTYDSPSVGAEGVTLEGVALPGSDDITDQGFEYWLVGGASGAPAHGAAAPATGITRVKATGQRMSATVSGLRSAAKYGFRSYATSGGRTYYGQEKTFTTSGRSTDVNGDGITDVADMNLIINIMLRKATLATWPAADVNGDGTVDVDDMNRAINVMLHKE